LIIGWLIIFLLFFSTQGSGRTGSSAFRKADAKTEDAVLLQVHGINSAGKVSSFSLFKIHVKT